MHKLLKYVYIQKAILSSYHNNLKRNWTKPLCYSLEPFMSVQVFDG